MTQSSLPSEPVLDSTTAALPAAATTSPPPRPRWPLAAVVGVAVTLTLAVTATGWGLYLSHRNAQNTVPGVYLDGEPLGALSFASLPEKIHTVSERFLSQRAKLRIGREHAQATWRDLGLRVDEQALLQKVRALGHSGDVAADLQTYLRGRRAGFRLPLQISVDEKRALDFLMELKDQVDRGAIDARLDLEKHTVAIEKPGYLLRVYDSLVTLQYAARALARGDVTTQQSPPELTLAVAEIAPQVRAEHLKDIDVSHVIASWETRYSNAAIDNDRTYNLKVGADKLNGYILRPGQVFSFNGAVGDRTEKEGYRVAPVISGGELIDGLAGGMCQIASTLHAAAFFAGLDIVRSTPHSRPSSYIPMGLDSTVVWPSVDLKLKNPYDFPIVVHYMVNQGSVKVELLGKELPHKIAFEREIIAESKFPTTTRPDPEMPLGQKLTDQEGYPGYRIKRRRYTFTGKWKTDSKDENRGKPEGLLSMREWDLSYPATTEIIRVGTGPATLKKKEPLPAHRIPAIPAWAKPLFVIQK